MASRHPDHGLRVVGPNSGKDPGSEREKLAETPFSGKVRLRELEQLAKTARRVRDDAERELADSRTSRAIAAQRISTCERTLQKAEEEMAEIRAELYHTEQLENDGNDFKSAEEFELAVLLGKTASAEKPAQQDNADLALSPLPKPDKRPRPKRVSPAPFHSVPRDSNPKPGNGRRMGFMLLVAAGALIGASLTYTTLRSPSIQENVKAIAADPGQLIKEVAEAVTETTAAPTAQTEIRTTQSPAPEAPVAQIPEQPPEPTGSVPHPTAVPAQPPTSTPADIFTRRTMENQPTSVIKDAGADIESRAPGAATASTDAVPTGQSTTGDVASSLPTAPDPGQLGGPAPPR